MKRLKLEIDALTVTSFSVAPAAEARGTVQAHVDTTPCQEFTPTCEVTGGIDSCWCSEYNSCECTSPVCA